MKNNYIFFFQQKDNSYIFFFLKNIFFLKSQRKDGTNKETDKYNYNNP